MQYSEDRSTGIVSAVTHTASGGMGMLDYELDPDVLSELKKNSVGVPIINAYYKNKSTMTKVIVSFFAQMKSFCWVFVLQFAAFLVYNYCTGGGVELVARLYNRVFNKNPIYGKCDQDIEEVIEKESEVDVNDAGEHSLQILDGDKKNYRDQ